MEPVTLSVSAIATLAFAKFIDQATDKFTDAALHKADELRKKIWEKMRGKPKVEEALTAIEKLSVSVSVAVKT